MRTILRTPTVADYHRLALSIGIIADLLECIGHIGARKTVNAGEVKVSTRSHTAVSGVGMVVSDRNIRAADDDARTTCCRTGMCTVVFALVVCGRTAAGNGGIFLGT